MKTLGGTLNLRELYAFVAVEETGSISRAAQRLGSSSPNVSQQISALERAVGTKLLDRRARPIILTPAGQMLRVHAHRILNTVSEAQVELAELKLSSLPRLSLAIIDDLDASLTPVLVSSLRKRFRNCFINAFSGRSDWVTDKLIRREVEVAVSGVVPRDSNAFRASTILREPFILLTARGLLRKRDNVLERLQTHPFVQYSETMPIGVQIAQHLNRVRFAVRKQFAFEASRSVFAMVVQARGWTLATPLTLLDADQFLSEVDVHPIPFGALSRRVHLIAHAGELGRLPERLARDCRHMLTERVIPRFAAIAPAIAREIDTAGS
jgi:DNA-binding transcriptional LysR family regulator